MEFRTKAEGGRWSEWQRTRIRSDHAVVALLTDSYKVWVEVACRTGVDGRIVRYRYRRAW